MVGVIVSSKALPVIVPVISAVRLPSIPSPHCDCSPLNLEANRPAISRETL